MQALVFGVAFIISIFLLIGCCLSPLVLIAQLYWAYRAYQGEYVTIPAITDCVKNQGCA